MQRKEQIYPYVTYDSDATRDMVVIDKQPYYKSSGSNSGLSGTWLPFVMMIGSKIHHHFNNEILYPVELQHPMENEHIEGYQKRFGLPDRDINGQPYYTIDSYFFMQNKEYKINSKYAEETGGMIIKADSGIINQHMIDINLDEINAILVEAGGGDHAAHRICRKEDLINSLRLGGGIWGQNEPMRSKSFDLLNENEKILANIPIQLNSEPLFKTTVPDQINDWLISQNARLLSELYELNGLKKVETLSSKTSDLRETLFFKNKKMETISTEYFSSSMTPAKSW